MIAVALLSMAGPRTTTTGALPAPPQFADVETIVVSRCSMCHAPEPVWPGFATAPNGVMLDTAERIRAHARLIAINAALSSAMPPGNITQISDEERRTLAAWAKAGTIAK
jgi:uncharacterized membrane protein